MTAVPILLRATVADSATVRFATVARLNPFADQLQRIPAVLRLGFYPIGLSLLLWVGCAFGIWRMAKDGEAALCWLLGGVLVTGAFIVEATTIPGESELFFLYMAMVLVAPVAGFGLCRLGMLLWRGRKRATPIAAAVVVLAGVGLHLKVGGTPSRPLLDGSEWTTGLEQRIEAGVRAYREPKPPSPPALSWADGPLLRMSPGVVSGLSWLRGVVTPSTLIATNVPGAAIYAALCECREFYQTEQYAPAYIAAHDVTGGTTTAFDSRARLLEAWISGRPGSVDALRRVGITFLIVDHVNGFAVPPSSMPAPAFSNSDISIYRV